jgi:hypothetical protein
VERRDFDRATEQMPPAGFILVLLLILAAMVWLILLVAER